MKTVLVIDLAADRVVDAVIFADDAVVDAGGGTVMLGEIAFTAPAGRLFFDGPGAIGWGWNGAAAVAPVPPTPDLTAYAADRRWRREVAGITVSGVPVATDDRSKLMIAGARLAAMADPDWSTPWHGADGVIYPLDATAIVAISDAVSAHVQATFAIFSTVKAAIEAGAITTIADIDAAFA